MAGRRHQMAGAAGEHGVVALDDNRGARRMLVGKPVRRIRQVVDLLLGVALRLPGMLIGRRARAEAPVGGVERPRPDGACRGFSVAWSVQAASARRKAQQAAGHRASSSWGSLLDRFHVLAKRLSLKPPNSEIIRPMARRTTNDKHPKFARRRDRHAVRRCFCLRTTAVRSGAAGSAGCAGARLRRCRRPIARSRRHDDGRRRERGIRLQGPSLRAQPRCPAALRVRRERQVHPSLWRGSVHAVARLADRSRTATSGRPMSARTS